MGLEGKETIITFIEEYFFKLLTIFNKNLFLSNCPLKNVCKGVNFAPAIIKPYGWTGYDGSGHNILSPLEVIACAKIAKPSFEPIVTIISLDGFKSTLNLFL